MYVYDITKLIEIYCFCDEFVQEFDACLLNKTLDSKKKKLRSPRLSIAEMLSIVIFYHVSGFKCFAYYYQHFILKTAKDCFPDAVSYARFVALQPRLLVYLSVLMSCFRRGSDTGTYFIDSTCLPVCSNKRIDRHRTFQGYAGRGKTSMGWFYGLKLHLIINDLGQVMAFRITRGNLADNNQKLLLNIFKKLKGDAYADKGYISQNAFENLFKQGLNLFTGIKKNMKVRCMKIKDAYMIKKRSLIETVNHLLKNICNISHTRHRSPVNAMVNIIAGLTAYTFLDDLPTFKKKLDRNKFHM